MNLVAILGGMLALAPAARADSGGCPLAVTVGGSEPARTTIANALASAGVATVPTQGCSAETVVVRTEGSMFELTITDPYGRVTQRTVTDLRAASALIQSTPGADALEPLLPEADAPALRSGDESADEVPVPPSEMQPRSTAVISETRPLDHPPPRGLSLVVAPELAMGSDGSRWAGLSVSGCVALGMTCVGTRVRFWQDLDAGAESNGTINQRTTGEIALSLDVPFNWHGVELRPGAELGLGWIHMGDLSVHPLPGDDGDLDQAEVLAGLNVSASHPLSKHWAIEAAVEATLSLFPHQAPFTVQGTPLPGEALAYGVFSLGVRYGSP